MIRHGAGSCTRSPRPTVPQVTVILRKAFGGAFITMNSKDLGADSCSPGRGAEIGVMGARQAVGIIHRRAIEAAADPDAERDRLAADYAETHLGAEAAAGAGDVDELIEPGETRARLIWALSALGGANGRRRTE